MSPLDYRDYLLLFAEFQCCLEFPYSLEKVGMSHRFYLQAKSKHSLEQPSSEILEALWEWRDCLNRESNTRELAHAEYAVDFHRWK